MFEKILQKLKDQRGTTSNVSDRSLEDMARNLEIIITTDEILEKSNFTETIKSIDGNLNHYTAKQVEDAKKAAEEGLVKKQKEEAEKLEKEKLEKEKLEKLKKGDVDIAETIAEAIKNAVSPLTEQISELKGEKIIKTRTESLNEVLKDAPDYYKTQVLSGFNNMSFENDEAFTKFTETTKTNFDAFTQQAKEQGLNTSTPKKEIKKEEKEDLNPVMKKAMAAHDEQAEASNLKKE